jgi:hypothetical protein
MNMTFEQVVLDVQVVIEERVVLFRIEHFEERRRRGRRGSPSTSCRLRPSRKIGFIVPAFFIIWMIWPGNAPM